MKKMERILMMVVTLLLCGTTLLHAEAVSPEQAKQVAARFITARNQSSSAQGAPRKAVKQSEMETSVVFDAADKAGQPYLYAVRLTEQGGYVLVSGDDRFTDVLGYSDANTFDEQNMPENMRAWLQGYIDEMAQLEAKDYQPAIRRGAGTKVAISPLIATQWNQNAPFNSLCPTDKYSGKTCLGGCVAAAMAQVVNYYMQKQNTPTNIQAAIEAYTPEQYWCVSADAVPAGTALPDKSLLINSYEGSPTSAQINAVAQLILYCGASVKMEYSSSGSGASSTYIPNALISNFGFDNTTHLVERADFTYADWMDLIYAELAAARPVIYGGESSGGGHSFIVDGYDGDGLFHINWGWSGHADDYFALSAVNPDDEGQSGASSSSDGYTMTQDAVIGIQIKGQTVDYPVRMSTRVVSVNSSTRRIVYEGWNRTGATYSFNIGIGFLEDNGTITLIGSPSSFNNVPNGAGRSDLAGTVPPNTGLAGQTKRIVPVSRKAGTATWLADPNSYIYYVEAKYDASGVPTLIKHPAFQLNGSDLSIPTGKFVDEEQIVKLSVSNTGEEFYGDLYLFASTTATKGTPVSKLGLTALAGSTNKVFMQWTPTATGTYTLWVATDEAGTNVIATEESVVITEDPSLAGKTLIISEFSFKGQDMDSYQVDANGIRSIDVYGDVLNGSVTVKNISSGTVSAYMQIKFEKYNESTGKYEADSYNSGYYGYSLPAGSSTPSLSIERSDLATYKTYRMVLTELGANPTRYDERFIIHLRLTGKPEATIASEPTPKTLTYTGVAQALVNPGSTEDGTMMYSTDNSNWSSSVPSAKDAGNYTVYYKVEADAYHTDNDGGSVAVTINKASLTVTAANKSVTYGGAAPTYSGTITGFKNGETASVLATQPTYSCPYAVGSDAGTYTITASGAAAANYTFSYNSGTLTVNKASLTVTADNQTVTYGGAAPAYSGTITGFKNGETASVLTTQPTYTCSYAVGNNVGTYTITASGATAANYNISHINGTLTVNAKTVSTPTIELGSYDAIYSGTAKEPTVTVKDVTTAIPSGEYNVVYNNNTNAGTASVTISDKSGGNYTVSGSTNFTINKASLTVTAANKSVTYGGAAPTYSGTITGFKNGETASVLTTQPTYSCSYAVGSNAGTYTITASGATAANYTFSYNTGTLTVNKAQSTLTAPTPKTELVQDGNAHELLDTYGSADGGELQYKVNDGAWTTSVPSATAAGSYTVYYQVVGDANHLDNAGSSFVVSIAEPAPIITEIDPLTANHSPLTVKIIKDNQILILRDGKTYTITGQEVK